MRRVRAPPEPRGVVTGLPVDGNHVSETFVVTRHGTGVFVANHGSRFDPELQPAGSGYDVVFIPFRDNAPAGPYKTVAYGFAGPGPLPDAALHRAVGLDAGPGRFALHHR